MSTADAATDPRSPSLMPPHLSTVSTTDVPLRDDQSAKSDSIVLDRAVEVPPPVRPGSVDSLSLGVATREINVADSSTATGPTSTDDTPDTTGPTSTDDTPDTTGPTSTDDTPDTTDEPTGNGAGDIVEATDQGRRDDQSAGHSAVLLAKTQATAALVQSEDLWRRLRTLEEQLADERYHAERTVEELEALRRELESERNERSAAQATSDELRQYLDRQQGNLGFLQDRIVSMESERDLQQSCLGWMGRRRFRRLLRQRWEANPHAALTGDHAGSAPFTGNALSVGDDAADPQFQPG